MRHRRIGIAIVLMVCATILGSLVPIVSRHAIGGHAGLIGGIMLALEIGAYCSAIALIVRQLRATSRAPLGRGSSHL
ncbi:hypothetical protein [Tanticharoenia sakaeratensis]|jgi:hypothetical protein|uniref:Uncharacterized protein n=1 Tax=Tanticharoenia sakaeratensis NBRC 103193 TaxID=1231623 RepID=A0A0D6MKX5_9PROT|nr:hypothetical protein [Tanticharoenia sakaeratensis]GAN53928.1 hypothetical protein Tasa_012_104 [Tanticharoenia sakaeratensis NBRC 103193]GBQ25289.1 hypothetical protein AA103193_3035 [Tanticharoenia sakaeratensis NBRC 103193]